MGQEGDLLLVQLKTTVTPFAAPKGSGGGSQHPVGAPKEVHKMLIIGSHKSATLLKLGRTNTV